MASPLLPFASLLYLALPWLVFAAGWLRPVPAAVVIGLLILTAIVELRRSDSRFQIPNSRRSAPLWNLESGIWNSVLQAIGIVLIGAIWTTLSGAGGWGFQNLDWYKHNVLLRDLIREQWPVDYGMLQSSGSRIVPLTYYIAYYLPAAAVGKAWGWEAAHQAIFVYTLLGVFLALLWFAALAGRSRIVAVLLFPLLSGLDVVGHALWSDRLVLRVGQIEWWTGLGAYQYSSNSTLLFWVPHHALAGWILTGLVVEGARERDGARFALLSLALATLWSPFVTIGLAPFVLAAIALGGWRSALTFPNLVTAPALALLAAAFLESRRDPVPHGWWFTQPGALSQWPKLAAFYVLEMGLFAWLSRPRGSNGRGHGRAWWWITVAVLLALPLYWMGRFNDLTMRASIPALFVLWSFVANALQDRSRVPRRIALAALVCIGAVTPATEILRGIDRTQWGVREVDPRPMLAQDPLYRFYVGDPSSWFFRHLSRPLRQIVTIEAEHPRPERAVLTQPDEAASDGRILVLDGKSAIDLTYGFEVERPLAGANLITRHRGPDAVGLALRIDGADRGSLALGPSADDWRFTETTIAAPLGAGRHELTVRGRAARIAIDAFILLEEP